MSGLFSRAKQKIANWVGSSSSSSGDSSKAAAAAANNNSSGSGAGGLSSPTSSTIGARFASSSGGNNSNSNSNSGMSSVQAGGGAALSSDGSPTSKDAGSQQQFVVSPVKLDQLDKVLSTATVDLTKLRNLCWCGVPDQSRRFESWCIMLRYLPPQVAAAGPAVLQRKRAEYGMFVKQHHASVNWDDLLAAQSQQGTAHGHSLAAGNFSTSLEDMNVMRQIRKDVPRTYGGIKMLQQPRAQLLLERVLFIWALRHPASGYVQGMNDILLPFLFVTLAKKISSDGDIYRLLALTDLDVKGICGSIRDTDWDEVEADSYWLLSAFMSGVQSNFTFSQGGTHALVKRMQTIVALAEPRLHGFLVEAGVSFEEFAFRWMNCFLLRELPPHIGVRLFDTYCAEELDSGHRGFGIFHVYVCAALLIRWSEAIRGIDDFAKLVQMLQSPPTKDFTEETVAELTAQAYVLMQQYESRVDTALKAASAAKARSQ